MFLLEDQIRVYLFFLFLRELDKIFNVSIKSHLHIFLGAHMVDKLNKRFSKLSFDLRDNCVH